MQYMKNQGILKYAFFCPNDKLDWNEMLATSLKNNSLKTLHNIVCKDLSGLQVTSTNCIVRSMNLRKISTNQCIKTKARKGERESLQMCQNIWLQKIFTTTSGLYTLSLYWYGSMHWALYCRISNVPWSVPQYVMLSVLQGAHKIFYWLFLHTPTVHIFQHHIPASWDKHILVISCKGISLLWMWKSENCDMM